MLIQYNTPQDHQRQKISLQKLDFPLPFALPATLFVKYLIGTEAYLEANSPNYAFAIILIFGVQVLASALLMAVILTVVYYKGAKSFAGLAIGGIVGLENRLLTRLKNDQFRSHHQIQCEEHDTSCVIKTSPLPD
jgi:hypothetical protein